MYAVLILYVLFTLFPVYWMVNTSFKHRVEQEVQPPHLWPFQPTTENWFAVLFPQEWGVQIYRRAMGTWFQWMKDRPFYTFVINSTVVASLATVACLGLSIPAAYTLCRIRSKRGKDVLFWIFSTRIVPPITVVLPYYMLFQMMGLLDTWWALIIVYIMYGIPFAVWMLRGFFLDLPTDLEESAMVFGCSRFGAFIRILVPIMASGIAATAILLFIQCWNEFLFAVTLTYFRQTAPVAISLLQTDRGVFYGQMCAADLLLIIPVLVGAYAVQKHLVRGLTLGAIKG